MNKKTLNALKWKKIEKTRKPRAGVYSSDLVYNAYLDLVEEINRFIPDYTSSGTIIGVKAKMLAKARIIELKAKSLVIACRGDVK